MSTSKLDLNVLLVLFRIWWVDFGVFSAGEGVEKVIGQGFGFVEGYFHIAVKFFCEGVAIVDAEDPFEEIYVNGDVQILPCVMVCQLSNDFRDFLSFYKDALRDAGVFHFGFSDKDGFI